MNGNDENNFQTQIAEKEKEQLTTIEKKLTESDKQEIKEINEFLKKSQENKDENIHLLPTLKVSDIAKEESKTPYSIRNT